MSRLDTDRQKLLEPKRLEHAKHRILELGLDIHYESNTEIRFMYEGAEIKFFPYSGWHTGKGIKDGRGLNKLLEQLRRLNNLLKQSKP